MKEQTFSLDILPEILREMAKMALEAVMQAEREVFLAEHGGTKNGHCTRNLDTSLGRLEACGYPETAKAASAPNCGRLINVAPWTWNG